MILGIKRGDMTYVERLIEPDSFPVAFACGALLFGCRLRPNLRAGGLIQEWARRGTRGGRGKKNKRLADYFDFLARIVFILQTNILCFKLGLFYIDMHKSMIL